MMDTIARMASEANNYSTANLFGYCIMQIHDAIVLSPLKLAGKSAPLFQPP
jgi:hypothetical protein